MLCEPKTEPAAPSDLAVFRFERRACTRRAQSGAAMAAFFDEDGALSLTRVELLDASPGGLGLRSPVAVDAGVRFCLYSRATPLPHTTGIVARCEPEEGEFRIGLRCDARLAA